MKCLMFVAHIQKDRLLKIGRGRPFLIHTGPTFWKGPFSYLILETNRYGSMFFTNDRIRNRMEKWDFDMILQFRVLKFYNDLDFCGKSKYHLLFFKEGHTGKYKESISTKPNLRRLNGMVG